MRISDWSSDGCSSDLDDTDAMNATANAIAAVLCKTEGAVDVRVEQTEGLPMLDIRPRREIMSRLGITAQTVQDTLSAAIGSSEERRGGQACGHTGELGWTAYHKTKHNKKTKDN